MGNLKYLFCKMLDERACINHSQSMSYFVCHYQCEGVCIAALVMQGGLHWECKGVCIGNAGGSALVMFECTHWCIGNARGSALD